MAMAKETKSAQIRARLDHPIIDADGHTIELTPIFLDYIKQVGGGKMVDRYLNRFAQIGRWSAMSHEERRDTWTPITPWWALPTGNTLDRATASLPRLLHERMDELGLDFTILYPSEGLSIITYPGIQDDELRRVAARALNTYHADVYQEYAGRMTPVAVIPMHTPQEAIEELEYSVKTLGLKAVLIAGDVRRPIPKVQREHPELADLAQYSDTFGIDSDYDYDPFWAKCVELKAAPTAHSITMGWGSRRSISRYMYNHIGHFAASSEALCKSLFFGGITRRFPTLKFAFLEGGVGWACNLYADMVGHWEKRNSEAIQHLDPAALDWEHMENLLVRYGDQKVAAKMDQLQQLFARPQPAPPVVDDWSECGIKRAEDIRDLFVPNFYFGCEADDPINAWAFNRKVNPFGVRLNAMFGSDIGHWDVPDMREVVKEAYEQVEEELMSEEDFRDFVFTNAVSLFAGTNPDFFKGTAVQASVESLISETPSALE